MTEDPFTLTEKALGCEIRTCCLIAMVNKVKQVLTDAKDGVGFSNEMEGLRNLLTSFKVKYPGLVLPGPIKMQH